MKISHSSHGHSDNRNDNFIDSDSHPYGNGNQRMQKGGLKMELNEYQKRAMSTCLDSSRNYVYMAEGLVGEVGEFTSKVAKMVRKNQAIVSDNHLFISEETQEENMKGLKDELGDILWFVSGIAEVLGWDLDSVAQDNIKKLASRQKRNVIDGNGDNR